MGSTSSTLIQGIAAGDDQAWQEFVGRYSPRLIAWCRGKGLSLEEAEDVKQEVLLRVTRRMRQTFVYDPARSFGAWLRTVWHSAWIDFLNDHPPAIWGNGDSAAARVLENIPGGDLTRELENVFDREVLLMAVEQIRPQVRTPSHLEAFLDLLAGQPIAEVARKHHLTVPGTKMARLRIQRLITPVIARLGGMGRDQGE